MIKISSVIVLIDWINSCCNIETVGCGPKSVRPWTTRLKICKELDKEAATFVLFCPKIGMSVYIASYWHKKVKKFHWWNKRLTYVGTKFKSGYEKTVGKVVTVSATVSHDLPQQRLTYTKIVFVSMMFYCYNDKQATIRKSHVL